MWSFIYGVLLIHANQRWNMKVIHIIKKIEEIDLDVRELKKLEKSIKKNKSFTTPIYMSIEKQVNILLGERIKMLELKIENPPEALRTQIEGVEKEEREKPVRKQAPELEKKKKEKETKAKISVEEDFPEEDTPMLTQEQIDAKINALESEKNKNKQNESVRAGSEKKLFNDNSVKILDIALEKGSLVDKDEKKDKDKKVRFFRDNFPVE
jgi:hypothetical protein